MSRPLAAAMLAAKRSARCSSRFSSLQRLNATSTATRALSSSIASPRSFAKAPVRLSNGFSLKLFSSSKLEFPGGMEEIDDTEEDEESNEWGEEEEWEEEDEGEPEIGDGGGGGGVVLRNVAWGERVLSIAHEVMLQIEEDIVMYAFKVSPKGYIYVRLDKLTNKYGCPSMEEIENVSNLYKKRLDEIGESGEIPDDLALQVSSPGAERLVRIPNDLDRFKDMPMWVLFSEENPDSKCHNHNDTKKVMLLDSFDLESQHCVWKLANVRENRDPESKGKPLSRKQKDWRLSLSFESIKRVTLYFDSK